jgi:hypothetical protein
VVKRTHTDLRTPGALYRTKAGVSTRRSEAAPLAACRQVGRAPCSEIPGDTFRYRPLVECAPAMFAGSRNYFLPRQSPTTFPLNLK